MARQKAGNRRKPCNIQPALQHTSSPATYIQPFNTRPGKRQPRRSGPRPTPKTRQCAPRQRPDDAQRAQEPTPKTRRRAPRPSRAQCTRGHAWKTSSLRFTQATTDAPAAVRPKRSGGANARGSPGRKTGVEHCELKDGITHQIEPIKRKRIRRFAGVVRTNRGGESTATGPNDFFNGLLTRAGVKAPPLGPMTLSTGC